MELKNIIEVTNTNFTSIVEENEIVIFDFWANWCGPCRALMPILAEFATKNPNVIVGKINVDEEKELSEKFKIRSIPTLVFYYKGTLKETIIGGRTVNELEELIKNV